MIINGGSRGGAAELASHLSRQDTNERVVVLESLCVGTVLLSTHGALQELAAQAVGSQCKKPLYSANINPEPGEPELTTAQWKHAVDRLEQGLGLQGHARHVVMHLKRGADARERAHVHVVWGRVDPATTHRAWHDGHNYAKHEAVSRALEREFGHAKVQGVHVERETLLERPVHHVQDNAYQRAQRVGVDLAGLRAQVSALRSNADSGRAFVAALAEHGLTLACGDRRDFVLVDPTGGLHNVARLLGERAKVVRAFLSDVDRSDLPSVDQAKALRTDRQEGDPQPKPADSDSRARSMPPRGDHSQTARFGGPQAGGRHPQPTENKASHPRPAPPRRSVEAQPGPQPRSVDLDTSSDTLSAPSRVDRPAAQAAGHQRGESHSQSEHSGPRRRGSWEQQYGDSPLYQRYLAARTARTEARQALLEELEVEQREAYARLSEQHRAREQRVYLLFHSPQIRKIWRAAAKAKAAQERQAHRRSYNEQRKAVFEAQRPRRWFDWVRDQAAAGDDEALAMLRRRSVREFRANDGAIATGMRPTSEPTGSRTLYRQYLDERDQWYAARAAQRDALYKEQQAAFARLNRRSHLRTSFVHWFVRTAKGREIWAGLSQQVETRERQRLNHAFAQRRRELDGARGFDTWAQWLRKQTAAGNPEARAASPTPFAVVDSVPAPGTVVYRVPGAQVQDDGERLTLSSAANPAAAEAFLHLAYAKFGARIDVDGNAAFREHLAKAAAITGLPITFVDPQMEARRNALQQAMNPAPNRRASTARPGPRPAVHARESYPTHPRRRQPARSIHDMPRLYTREVATDGPALPVSLKADAQPDLRPQQPPHQGTGSGARRTPPEPRMNRPRKRKGRRR